MMKVEGISMEKALRDQVHGGPQLVEPSEQKAKKAKISTKSTKGSKTKGWHKEVMKLNITLPANLPHNRKGD
jgi:hypothetical protein